MPLSVCEYEFCSKNSFCECIIRHIYVLMGMRWVAHMGEKCHRSDGVAMAKRRCWETHANFTCDQSHSHRISQNERVLRETRPCSTPKKPTKTQQQLMCKEAGCSYQTSVSGHLKRHAKAQTAMDFQPHKTTF